MNVLELVIIIIVIIINYIISYHSFFIKINRLRNAKSNILQFIIIYNGTPLLDIQTLNQFLFFSVWQQPLKSIILFTNVCPPLSQLLQCITIDVHCALCFIITHIFDILLSYYYMIVLKIVFVQDYNNWKTVSASALTILYSVKTVFRFTVK